MPTSVTYFYNVDVFRYDDDGNKISEKIPCTASLKAYDFSVVNRSALCYAAPGTKLTYAKPNIDDKGRTITISAEYTVGDNGEWIDLGVSSIKPA